MVKDLRETSFSMRKGYRKTFIVGFRFLNVLSLSFPCLEEVFGRKLAKILAYPAIRLFKVVD